MKKILLLFLGFYLLAVFQTGFLAAFSSGIINLNLVFLTVILINIFSKNWQVFGLGGSLAGGLLLDILSAKPIGYHILILLTITLLLNLLLKKYVWIPLPKMA